jgi:hypothetical protein
MNYSININQVAAVTHFPNLDIIDVAIFDCIMRFQGKCEKYSDALGIWFWISHKKIQNDLPILNIKSKQALINRINKLIDSGILERHPSHKMLSRSYYRAGEKWDLLIKMDTSQPNFSAPPENDGEAPPKNDGEDHNTILDPNTIDPNLNWKNDFEIYKKELNEAFKELLADKEFILKQEKYNQNLNIELTLEKAISNYWSTEEAWRKKKKSKIKTINWRNTLTNALSQPLNKVYKPFNNKEENVYKQPKLRYLDEE